MKNYIYLIFLFTVLSCANEPMVKSNFLFYLHGKIIEDNGLRAHSHKYGAYEYKNIIDSLHASGFEVISEIRTKNTNVKEYASKVVSQVDSLIELGIPPKKINIIGASKGGFIALEVSHQLQLKEIKYVILAACDKDNMPTFSGKVLSIYDASDGFASDCRFLGKAQGFAKFEEIKTKTGLGHGLIYKPYVEWLKPSVEWCTQE